MPKSKIEELMAVQILVTKLPKPKREYRFHPTRKWRFDFAWPEQMVALECEGGGFVMGRHGRGQGFAADCEKYNEAALLGWTVIRVTGDQVKKGRAIEWVEGILRGGQNEN